MMAVFAPLRSGGDELGIGSETQPWHWKLFVKILTSIFIASRQVPQAKASALAGMVRITASKVTAKPKRKGVNQFRKEEVWFAASRLRSR